MWILVVGPEGVMDREEGAAAILRELGCRVQTANLWDSLDDPELIEEPPTVILVEAIDEVDAGRAALVRLRAARPLVDVPVATLSGDPEPGTSLEDVQGDVCVLFGTTTPFDRSTLVELYGTADEYVERFGASAAEAVDAGFLLQPDADVLIGEAEANRALF